MQKNQMSDQELGKNSLKLEINPVENGEIFQCTSVVKFKESTVCLSFLPSTGVWKDFWRPLAGLIRKMTEGSIKSKNLSHKFYFFLWKILPTFL